MEPKQIQLVYNGNSSTEYGNIIEHTDESITYIKMPFITFGNGNIGGLNKSNTAMLFSIIKNNPETYIEEIYKYFSHENGFNNAAQNIFKNIVVINFDDWDTVTVNDLSLESQIWYNHVSRYTFDLYSYWNKDSYKIHFAESDIENFYIKANEITGKTFHVNIIAVSKSSNKITEKIIKFSRAQIENLSNKIDKKIADYLINKFGESCRTINNLLIVE